MVSLILGADSSANNVWPGFSLSSRNLLIYDKTGGYLITTQARPASFEPLPDSVSVPRNRELVYWRRGEFGGLGDGYWSTQYLIDGLTVSAYPASTIEDVRFIYHETFHAYQSERFVFETADSSSDDRVFTPEYAASVEVERKILHKALSSTGALHDSLVGQFLAVRLSRQRRAPGVFTTEERNAERREGLADFVGHSSSMHTLKESEEQLLKRVKHNLKAPLKSGFSLGEGGPEERLIRLRSYGTGAAMALLLERRGSDWKQKAEQGAALDQLLAAAAALDTTRVDNMALEARVSFGYEKLLALRNPPWGSLVEMRESDFDALGKYRLIVEVDDGASSTWHPGPQGMYDPAEGVTIMPDLRTLRVYDPDLLLLEVKNRPVKFDFRSLSTVTIMLDAPPQIDGATVVSGGSLLLSSGSIRAKGVTIKISGPVQIVSDAVSMRVKDGG
jgi:hypothetical protein